MVFNSEVQKYQIFVQTTPVSGETMPYKFVYKNKTVNDLPENDFILPIMLNKTHDYIGYVDVKKDESVFEIERQEVNPFFIELEFFDNVTTADLSKGYQLTPQTINFIREKRLDQAEKTNLEIKDWYENYGYLQLPWDKGGKREVTLEDLENMNIITDTIVGQANVLNITINR